MGNRGKTVEKNRAQDLRAAGWTYREIVEELGVSRSSVSLWCRAVAVDPTLLDARRRRNYERGNRHKRPSSLRVAKLAEIERFKTEGRERMAAVTDDEHLQFGLGLYAGDGSKHEFGCAHLSYGCTAIQRKILGLIGGLVQFDFLPG